MSRKNEIVDAEFTVVEEQPTQDQRPVFDLENVGEMVMVGRHKNGQEFVHVFNFDDALKAKAYCDYGFNYFQAIIEQAIYNRLNNKGNN